MGVKFRMAFKNVQDDDCVVTFDFADYDGDYIEIYGGARPFVLGEFNSDDDIFKPVRPQQATIEILASASGIDMEDFLTDNDTDVLVKFDFGVNLGYWYGYLSQEDIQETWIASNHILILRADDGIGRLKQIPLQDNGANVVGTYTPYAFIEYAIENAVPRFGRNTVYSNLFHTSMVSTSNQTGIDQCMIDARTFEQSVGQFDDAYTILEKINRSWSQTLFQYLGDFFILRVEELFTDQNLVGFKFNTPTPGQRGARNRRYDIEVGVEQAVKPIAPEMLKTYQKPSKQTTINFNWDKFEQAVCNESFTSGIRTEDFLGGTGTEKWSVNDWEFQKIDVTNPTPSTAVFERRIEYENYKVKDDYIYLGQESPFSVNDNYNFTRSCDVYVQQGDNVDFDFQYKIESNGVFDSSVTITLGYIMLYADDGTKYALTTFDNSISQFRVWSEYTNNANIRPIFYIGPVPKEWVTYSQRFDDNLGISNQPVPKNGYINVVLFRDYENVGYEGVYFKDLNLDITSEAERNRKRKIKGDYDRYTIQKNVVNNYSETIYLDDAETNVIKGAIYEMNGFTLTGDEWFRRRYSSERYTFKRQHALARWFMNRSYKMKLEASFFGLRFGIDEEPIGLINTIKFVDDAPTKIFWISNLREIDFMNCTWVASLIEVFDTAVTDNAPTDQDVHTFDFYYE
jgi:hypothetical protein